MTIPHRPQTPIERELLATDPRSLGLRHDDTVAGSFANVSNGKDRAKDVDGAADKLLQIGELAHASGKTVRAIHLYEELGLLRPDGRSKGRFRLYDPQAVTRVRWIGKLHDLGMSLAQIQEVVSSWESASSAGRAMSQMRSVYASKLDETRAQIGRLRDLERELSESIAYLDTCETCDSSLVGELPIPDYATGHVRRLPQVGMHQHSMSGALSVGAEGGSEGAASEGGSAPEVGSCKTCEMRERENEPELVAGIHHYPVVDATLASPSNAQRVPHAASSARGRASKPTTSPR